MKTWDDLTPEQRTFIKRHLKRSPKDLFRKRRRTETNREIIAAYGNYTELKAIYDNRSAQVPDDYGHRVPMEQLAARAQQYCDAGDFERAANVITFATSQMDDLREILTADADKLRDAVAPVPGVGFGETDARAIDAARQAVLQHLTAPLPTATHMTAARGAYTAYEAAVLSGLAGMGDVDAATGALQQAKTQGEATVDATAALDVTPFATTPQATELAEVVADAGDIQTDILLIADNDSKAMRVLADRITLFARQNRAATLVIAATQHLVVAATTAYGLHSAALQAGQNATLDRFDQQAEHANMIALQQAITGDIAYIQAQIAARDPSVLATLGTRIDQAAERARQLEALQKTVGTRMLREKLAADGAKEAHQDGIIRLKEVNGDAADKVIEILERDSAILNGAQATPDFIRAETAALSTLVGERKTLADECNAANVDREAKQARVDELKALETAELAKLLATPGTAPGDLTQLITIRADLGQARLDRDTAHQTHVAKYGEWTAKDAEVKAKDGLLTAAKNQRAMLDAVTFGPLSPVAGRPIPDDMVADVVELFGRNPALAIQTCELAATAKDPKSLAETAKFLADQSATGFAFQPPAGDDGVVPPPIGMNADGAAQYSRQLLARAAYLGPEFANEAQDAIARGVHFAQNPELIGTPNNVKAVAAKRGAQAADAMMAQTVAPDGTITVALDLDGDAFKAVLERQKFSGIGQVQASTMMNVEMDKLQDFFGDPVEGAARKAQAETILNSVTAVPASPAARELLTKSLGIPAADFDDPAKAEQVKQQIRTAILKSMVTPIAQGDVGSCFATAPLRKMREDDPLAVMEMYRDIATTGIYRPKNGRPVPAVVKFPAGDDPLTRSLEYSVAAASARLASSRERGHTNGVMFDPRDPGNPTLGRLGDVLKKKEWRKLEPHLVAKVAGGYTFTYDPLSTAGGPSNDDSSSRGVMQMVAKDTGLPILSDADFLDFIRRNARQAVLDAGLSDTVRDKVLDYVNEPAFIAAVERLSGNAKPWQLPGGGFGDSAGDALIGRGGNKRSTDLIAESATDTSEQRALKVVKSLGALSDESMTMVSTSGMHAFNALPPEGPTKDLMTGDVDANIQSMLIAPGRKIATDPLPTERAVYLFDKQMEHAMQMTWTDAERDAVRAVWGDRPTAPMTPAQLETHIATKLDAVRTLAADRRANDWATKQTTPPTPEALADKKTEMKTSEEKNGRDATARTLIKDLGVPEFVVADPNWGDEADHRQFVIAPDPITGEVRLWQKTVMSGELYPMDDKWLQANWRLDQ